MQELQEPVLHENNGGKAEQGSSGASSVWLGMRRQREVSGTQLRLADYPMAQSAQEYPQDTPKKNGEYWVCYEDSVNIGHLGYELWIFINEKWNYTAKVVAWCETPKFDEQEGTNG